MKKVKNRFYKKTALFTWAAVPKNYVPFWGEMAYSVSGLYPQKSAATHLDAVLKLQLKYCNQLEGDFSLLIC